MLFSDIRPYVRFARYMTLSPSDSYKPHIPYDARLFYACDGFGEIVIGNKSYAMSEGSVLIINSGVEYYLKSPVKSVKYIAFNFDYTQAGNSFVIPIPPESGKAFKPEKIIENMTFSDMPGFNVCTYIESCRSVQKTAVKTVTEYNQKLIDYNLKTSCLMTEMLIDCARSYKTAALARDMKSNEIISYIHENYMNPITNAELGKKFGFHPNYICRIIKKCTGLPLHKYVLHIRILRAIELLEMKNYPLKRISDECGFYDLYYFSKYFKKATGISPSKYIKH